MDPFDKQKELRIAMNGRMSLMMAGIFLIFTAVTSTMMYGANIFMIALEAAKGTEEYVDVLKTANMSITLARVTAICFILEGIAEIFCGVCSFRFCNRVDKSKLMLKIAISLLVIEVAMQIYLFCMRMMNLGTLISALVIPLFMIWGATRLRKLAKAFPDRVYALDNKKGRAPQYGAKSASASSSAGRSLHDRAMMKATYEPADEYDFKDEINDSSQTDVKGSSDTESTKSCDESEAEFEAVQTESESES